MSKYLKFKDLKRKSHDFKTNSTKARCEILVTKFQASIKIGYQRLKKVKKYPKQNIF